MKNGLVLVILEELLNRSVEILKNKKEIIEKLDKKDD